MAVALTTPVTGGAQTGFTNPTYTIAADSALVSTAKQYAVTAVGGTQVGVDASSTVSRPFTVTLFRPVLYKALGPINPLTNRLSSVPRNTYKCIVRKGVTPLSGQPSTNLVATLTIDVPAGADVADSANIRAALSLLIGALSQVSSGLGDSIINGVW